MDDGSVLDIGSGPDTDRIHVPAQDAVVPDADVGPDFDIADYAAPRRDERGGVDDRRLALKADDRRRAQRSPLARRSTP